ncbi:ATPase associated with various cellular activities AAA_5 [Hyphomicrobium sp. MC1]|nr:ATPase associated with various cellular activities AAA_5 [Hyphomicrobium sp. MC1]
MVMTSRQIPADYEALGSELEAVGYFAEETVSASVFLALQLHRPLFCEGEPGVGKTALAHAVSEAFGWPLFRLQCYEGLDESDALYAWDFSRQLLHMRVAETVGRQDADGLESELYDRKFLQPRAILKAFETTPSVLLIDEVDRADDEFEAFLLEALSEYAITVPQLGTIKAAIPPFVIVTSNRTRDVHDALKRRCLYQWIEHPNIARERAIIERCFPAIPTRLADQILAAVARLRGAGMLKAPGIAESLDWARSLLALGATEMTPREAALTLGTVLKYHEDQARVIAGKYSLLVPQGA